ncbi:MAG: thymidylate synthase [Candidatus Margulisiibacteriota bacterium]|nr:thymidylate synthase [Candidatus Margulisiibacteriota bacterium]
MKEYLKLIGHILDTGEEKSDRTGTGTISTFGTQSRYDLRDGFPLVTTKKVYFSSMLRELLWFIKGSTNINDNLNTKIWDAWADADGNLGPIYGYQWRFWEKHTEEDGTTKKEHVDQLANLIDSLKNNPDSRRHIVSAWNVADLDRMALPPCHTFFQCYVCNGHLDLQLYQRSADVAVGVPFNIASYSLLLMMLAQECNLTPRYFIHTIGDAHLYTNHLDGVKEQLTRSPKARPTVTIAKKPFFELEYEDFNLNDYVHDEFIKFEVAV